MILYIMKTSELIKILEEHKKQYWDMQVMLWDKVQKWHQKINCFRTIEDNYFIIE